ncbi:hypothetical protein WA026_022158 [Henosepilachna vigintioctopunctata]|uniref:Uncharacterized protein n=1 Tax=Henosepilachna vigintioctopunctata TaxID=420089 RepID=A0AAW1TSP7_9CUCU
MTAELPLKKIAPFCKCPPPIHSVAEPDDVDKKHFEEIRTETDTRTVDFGAVVPGTTITKSIEITNKSNIQTIYSIQRKSYVHDIYQSFHFNKYDIRINPQSSAQVKITYSPLIEYEKSVDCFSVLTKDSTELEKIFLRGRCLGTCIKSSTRRLYFIKTPNIRKNLKTFELKNTSEVPATFQVDTDVGTGNLFQVDITNGQIQAKKSIYITISFNATTDGVYYRRLAILIYKHEPILIDLVGIYNKDKDYINEPTSLTFYPNEANSPYSAYFFDYGYSEEKIFPVKLNHSYFDFGRAILYGSTSSNMNILVGILKNNLQRDISVKWCKDPDNVFFLLPEEMKIRADESGYFEVRFQPDFGDHMYCSTMSAQICWKIPTRPNTPVLKTSSNKPTEEENIPLIANLTLIGHTFPQNQSWINSVEVIPHKVIFPACTPRQQSFATFMLKTDGHLPMLFKFLPPKKSYIEVKPRMGMMRFTKFFVAKITTGDLPEVYQEDWRLEINGESQRYCHVTFQGQSAIPSIVVGKANTITFNTTQPGCQDIITVPVINTSGYHLKINLVEDHECFHSAPATLELYPNEEIQTTWTFTGKPYVPLQSEINCSMRVISNLNELIGLPFGVSVIINAQCEYSQLCATPRYKDFGDIPWGAILFPESGNDNRKADIRILNSKGKLTPNDAAIIKLSFDATNDGENVVQIIYFTRLNENVEEVTNHSAVDLFSMRYNCIHPTIQIVECVEHTLGKIFSKLDVWNILRVNKINEQLSVVKENEVKIIKLSLPFVECHEKVHRIRFVLSNTTKFDLNATLSRVRMCQCKTMEISKSLSFRRKVFQCPHRNMLMMKLSDENIIGNSFQYLDIFLNFNLTTDEEIAYDMKLSKNRHIQFCFQMNIIPRDMQKLSVYNSNNFKKLANMFIGAKEPPFQTYWLYNNTSKANSYQIVDEEFSRINEIEGFPVFSCLNNKGVVPPFSSVVVLFRFHPIEAKKYQVTLPVLLGHEKISLKLSGRGSYKYDNKLIQNLNNNIPKMSLNNGDFPVTLSVDYMLVGVFPVWFTIYKLLYMRNVTKDRITEYTWQRCSIGGVIEITVDKPSGILHPEETVGIILKIKSLENPTISTINLPCKIIDITQNELNQKSIQRHAERQKYVDQFFVIDEKGTHTEENSYTIEPPSEELYLTLAITFHTVSTLEMSHYLEVSDLLGQNPFESFQSGANHDNLQNFDNTNSKEQASSDSCDKLICKYDPIICQIMECFIMDTLRSPIFKQMVLCQKKSTPPYYVQFKYDEPSKTKYKKMRDAEIKKYFAKPQMKKLSCAFKYLIKDSIEDIFF